MVSTNLERRYLELLARDYPNRYAAFTEIINLQAILNLPKGTEHFISDLHGEYEAFCHILNNCSGVIREKAEAVFAEMDDKERAQLLSLIYYPKQKQQLLSKNGELNNAWYRETLKKLITLTGFLSSRYTRSKVRKAIPHEFNYIIDELLHAKVDEDNNRLNYHRRILDSIIDTGAAPHFINSLCALIKRLAVDHLHIVGDIFDRGARPDSIMDLLMEYHSLDIEWGNHDMLWMGAAAGSRLCIATLIRNNINYGNYEILENGYGISMRSLAMFAQKTYQNDEKLSALEKAISVIIFKLQGEVISRHEEFDMNDRLFLDKIDYEKGTVLIDGREYELKTLDFPTIDRLDPYRLSSEEEQICRELQQAFLGSKRLQKHISFLLSHGAMYKVFNGNLLYHGCIPLNPDGTFRRVLCRGRYVQGKSYLDMADAVARRGFLERDPDDLDYMWYFWCGRYSPLSGRVIKTFERALCCDRSICEEPRDHYYSLYHREEVCRMILKEFNLDPDHGHIINGHTPIRVKEGESPVRGNGRLLVIDGGLCHAYHNTTGIAGYTLIFNSHGLRLKAHRPFSSIDEVLLENSDIESESFQVESFSKRMMIADCDVGVEIKANIESLQQLLKAFREGKIPESG